MLGADIAVEYDEPPLEINRQRDNNRRDDDDGHRQRRGQPEHHAEHAEDIRESPEDIRKDPRDAGRNSVCIRHDARERMTRACHVVIVKAELLQVDEASVLHVAPAVHLQPHARLEIDEQRHDFKRHDGSVTQRIAAEPRGRPLRDEGIDDFALQQRNVKIRRRHQQVADDGNRKAHTMLANASPKPFPRFDGESRLFVLFPLAHQASSSPCADCIAAVCANTPPA